MSWNIVVNISLFIKSPTDNIYNELVGSHVTQVSEKLELVFEEQVSLAGVAQGELGELRPGAALGGGHVHHVVLLADLLAKVSVVHAILSVESKD